MDKTRVKCIIVGVGGGIMAIKTTSIKSKNKKTYNYDPQSAAKEAYQSYRQLEASTPDYTTKIGKLAQDIANRERFSYNPATDAAYQYYADRYRRQGKLAMQDTVGQATQLSGGYDNSYANTVGQQQYNAYLAELGGVIPSLKDAALNTYNAEGNDLNNRLAALQAAQAARDGKIDAAYQRWATLQSAADAAVKAKTGGGGSGGRGGRRGSGGSSNATAIKNASLDTLAQSFGGELMAYRSAYAVNNGGAVNAPYTLDGQVVSGNRVDDNTQFRMIDYLVSEGFTKTRAKELLKYMGFSD